MDHVGLRQRADALAHVLDQFSAQRVGGRHALFQRAAEQVRGEVQKKTWQAFWETSIVGTSATDAAKKLGMAVGAVRVAKCRVLARLKATITKWEQAT